MKFACLIFAYKDPEQLKRTINALGDMDIFVHVDKKVDITPFKELIKTNNVEWVEDRVFVCWGGYSQFDAYRKLMACVIKKRKEYDRIIVITALDYPILQARALENYFSKDSSRNYCTTLNITRSNNRQSLSKIQKYWFYDIRIKNYNLMRIVRKLINAFASFLYLIGLLKKNSTINVGAERWDVYFGSESCCLTYECFMYVNEVINSRPEIENYFKYSFAPIELVVATILSNSIYKTTITEIDTQDYYGLESVSPLYYMEYDEAGGTGMKVLNESDYEKIINSGKPFCRKVSSVISQKLEDRIDEHNTIVKNYG